MSTSAFCTAVPDTPTRMVGSDLSDAQRRVRRAARELGDRAIGPHVERRESEQRYPSATRNAPGAIQIHGG